MIVSTFRQKSYSGIMVVLLESPSPWQGRISLHEKNSAFNYPQVFEKNHMIRFLIVHGPKTTKKGK